MLADLFADSERKILKALDRGLEDFVAGKIQNLGGESSSSSTQRSGRSSAASSPSSTQSFQEGQEAILEEILQEDSRMEVAKNQPPQNGFVEAHVVQKNGVDLRNSSETANGKKTATEERREAVLKSMNATLLSTTTKAEESVTGTGLEFAVQAAKQAHAKRQRQKEQGIHDFAVQAAKTATSRRLSNTKAPSNPPAPLQVEPESDATVVDPASIDLSKIRPPVLDPSVSGVRRAFMTSISTPTDYAKKQGARDRKGRPSKAQKDDVPTEKRGRKGMSSSAPKEKFEPAVTKTDSPRTKKKLNLSVQENAKEPTVGLTAERSDSQTNEIVKAAQDALSEIAEQGKEMSPEELLASVMQFGDEQERAEAVGNGFVSGAFDKAKDILREQKEKRDDRVASPKSLNELGPNSLDPQREDVGELTPEEELRRMFEAGERIADGRITRVQSPLKDQETSIAADSGTSEKDVELLIDQEKTVSRHARILDDELAELEVRINKSPGEDLDGPAKNPMFDIFSGPEYNPNVNPETSVNWPGAQRGSKQIRLPKELDEAVKQAKFATEVLLGMKKVETSDGSTKFTIGDRELSGSQIAKFRAVVEEAVEIGLIEDPLEIKAEASRLQMLLDELWNQPEERNREIASNYKDLLLSDSFPQLVKQRMNQMADRDLDALRRDDDSLESAHARERELLAQLVAYAQLLLKETRALGAELESQQLEVIRSICKVAMDPSHQTEEETSMALTDAVRDMRPLFDDCFVAYLKYAVAEEEGRLARAGVLDDPEHNQWLFVLKIVQQGVYTEIARGINRYIEHIWYIIRMETPKERRMLLEKLVDVMPTLDVRPFVQVVQNIVGSLGQGVSGDFDGITPLGEMTNKLLQLHRDVKDVLPPERIAEMSRDADEWAAKQRERLLEQRNLTKQRLKASQATEQFDNEIESFGQRGEVERFS